jgi:hypothetical protein
LAEPLGSAEPRLKNTALEYQQISISPMDVFGKNNLLLKLNFPGDLQLLKPELISKRSKTKLSKTLSKYKLKRKLN